MKKTYSESELMEKANQVFADFPNANTVFATADGNVFLMENRARLHAKAEGSVYPFYRPQENEAANTENDAPDEPKPLNANAAIAFIKVATTVEAIAPLENDSRATVKAAYEKRKKELETPVASPGTETTQTTPETGSNTEQQ